ncbi:Zn-dependent peptidase ImmA (M78 family) [Paenibacillus sp. V4I3]|uniref:ImmA/IrrE family metallo-endopeptidase n=1 Tax=Paenibacillus sp. V4I3 TaxID=3042305 RepID=UPI002784C031|nr:ImmA/IrrE family metallo-endopeptidase [Paenibacillus sp. V4I3]MDQ0876797.1 Zn-dependent peptidase ImmA (M78 family) [Paenibacillus sp. V4I3]
MYLTYYKPTDIEIWINQQYQSSGIHYASELDLDRIADLFGIELHIYDGKSFADWKDDSHRFILLNISLQPAQRRAEFFHELCHPLRHVGNQDGMGKLFKELQEIQATQFQYYAAMPFYMLEEFKDISPSLLVKTMAEEFMLPDRFVERRLDQVKRRLQMGRQDAELNERMKTPVKVDMAHVRRVMEEFGRKQRERQGAY